MKKILEKQLELVKKVKAEKCEKCYKQLLEEYEPLIKSLSASFKKKYMCTPIEIDDIKNVMSYHFYKLVLDYDENREKTFPSYVKEFLYYRTSTWIKHYITLNHQVMNYSENNVDNSSQKMDKLYLYEEILDTNKTTNLSKLEIEIIELTKNGYTIKEISEKINVNIKTLYAAKNRAIEKIQNNFQTNRY